MKKIEIKKPGVLFAVFLILMALALFPQHVGKRRAGGSR